MGEQGLSGKEDWSHHATCPWRAQRSGDLNRYRRVYSMPYTRVLFHPPPQVRALLINSPAPLPNPTYLTSRPIQEVHNEQ